MKAQDAILIVIAMFGTALIILNVMFAVNWGQKPFFNPYTQWWGWMMGVMSWIIATGVAFMLLRCPPGRASAQQF